MQSDDVVLSDLKYCPIYDMTCILQNVVLKDGIYVSSNKQNKALAYSLDISLMTRP